MQSGMIFAAFIVAIFVVGSLVVSREPSSARLKMSAEAVAALDRRRDRRIVAVAAFAFVWWPALCMAVAYLIRYASIEGPLEKVPAILFPLTPMILIFAIVALLTTKHQARWLFISLNVIALLLPMTFCFAPFTGGIYR